MNLPVHIALVLSLAPVCQAPVIAQGGKTETKAAAKPVEGTLLIGTKTYNLTHALAYPTKSFDEAATGVLFTDRAIDAAAIAKSLKENDGEDTDVSPRGPHLKIVFDAEGKAISCFCYASGTSISTSSSKVEASLKKEGAVATGYVKLAPEGADNFRRSIDLKFTAPLLGSAATSASSTGPAQPLAKVGVTGKFIGNGKEAKLAFISAYPREAFADKSSLTIVMTEKDHSRDKKPDIKAQFGDYGNALIISCHEEDGKIFSCVVSHAAHSKRGFSSVGAINTLEFQIAGGQVQGLLKTDGEEEFFDDKWLVDLKFAAPYTSPKKAAPSTTEATKPSPARPSKPEPADPAPMPKPATAKLNVKDLAILKDVPDVEYKTLVEQVAFASTKPYKTLATELTKQLAAQGWQTEGSDLYGVSCILKRKRGEAELTIFVKPDGTGSKVTIFTEGLDWDK
ncbi:hypothetical protein NA78x_003902 [Anatilimnocola sp. NA78]|uniref:hypothetical protein n=1 Tax=Anatilimnocola sp. NA78 TaxID=3415683 RepID=UPI003CE5B727